MPPVVNQQIPGAFSAAVLGAGGETEEKYGGNRYDEWLEAVEKHAAKYRLPLEDAVALTVKRAGGDTNYEYGQRFFLEQTTPGISASDLNELISGPLELGEDYEKRVGPEKLQASIAGQNMFLDRMQSAEKQMSGEALRTWDEEDAASGWYEDEAPLIQEREGLAPDMFTGDEGAPKEDSRATSTGAASKGAADFEGGPATVLMKNGRTFDAIDVREDGEFYTLSFGDGNEMSIPKAQVESIESEKQNRFEALEVAPRPRQ